MLLVPEEGYLEGGDGPVPIRDVEWVEVSTMRVKGGMAGLPLRMVDIKDDLLAALGQTRLTWEIREAVWSVERFFADEPVQLIRLLNPFGPTPPKLP